MNTNDNNMQNNVPVMNGSEGNIMPTDSQNQSLFAAPDNNQMANQPMMNNQMMMGQMIPNNQMQGYGMMPNNQMANQPMMNNQMMPNNQMMMGQMMPNNQMQGNVTPTPMPATPNEVVNPMPMPVPANPSPINPTLLNSNSPTSVSSSVNNAPQEFVNPGPVGDTPVPGNVPQEVVMPVLNADDVTVVNTKRTKKGGGFGVIVIIIIMVLVVLNFDKVEELYNKYIKENNFLFKNTETDNNNLYGGYISVDDATSTDQIDNIRFSDFNTRTANKLSFQYSSEESIQNVSSHQIYIEIYDVNKNIIYKSLFEPKSDIKKNTVEVYEVDLAQDIFTRVKYASVKKYTSDDLTRIASLTCSLTEDNGSYKVVHKNKFSFVNNELTTYSVSDELIVIEDSVESLNYKASMGETKTLLTELSPILEGNVLTYNVDTSRSYTSYTLVEEAGTTPTTVKNREEAKKWKCE